MIRLLRAIEYRSMPWKNGGGSTREIARDESGEPPAWRISIAAIERDGAFSDFRGYDRTMLPLSGIPFELRFEGREPLRAQSLAHPVRFSGDWKCECRLLGGPAEDLNVMTKRDRFSHRVRVLRPNSERLPLSQAAMHFIYVLDGEHAGDTWQVQGEDRLDLRAARVCVVTISQTG